MQQEFVRIPRERVAVLIGKDGEVKKEIERELRVKLIIDSEEGMVTVKNVGDDVLACWKGRDMIKAIGRGINPEKAMLLARDDYVLEILDLTDILGRSEKAIKRQKARIIGRKGKTRRYIEEQTGAVMAVSGKTVAFLGMPEEVGVAKEAVLKLVSGMPHGVVYRYLERKALKMKEARVSLWKTRGP
ncbi:MAG: RNA-processing protein [Euryarchaeota archaeon]|nr:RNA-processing protein [Euryarchaeota archaeon]